MKVETKRKIIIFIAGGIFFLAVFPMLFNFHGNTHGEILNTSPTSDQNPPVTTKEYGNPFYEDMRGEWIGASTKIWLNATDDDSGVHYTHYEAWRDSDGDGIFETLEKNVTIYDGGAGDYNPSYGIISTYFNLSNSCHHEIIFYSVDYAGNTESHMSGTLYAEWNYPFQPNGDHIVDDGRMIFGSSPAIANLCVNEKGGEPDANLEIVCGSDEMANYYPAIKKYSNDGIWRCFDSAGNVEWATPTRTDQARSSPAIADIDGDGNFEIAGGTTSGWFTEVMDCNGGFIWTFPKTLDSNHIGGGPHIWHSSPALADVCDAPDGSLDGLEVIIGDNPHGELWCFDGNNSDGINNSIVFQRSYFPGFILWNLHKGGTEGIDWDPIWIFQAGGRIIATPAVGDVDADGEPEVVIGSLDGKIYVVNAEDGSMEWNYTTGASVFSSAAIANIDSDANLEIVVGSNDTYLYCLDGGGSLQWRYKTNGPIYSSPAIGDVDGDGKLEIVFGSLDSYVYCLNSTGSLEWKFKTNAPVYSSPALAKMGRVIPYQMDWPMFRHDNNRTGFYGNTKGPLEVFIGSDDWNLYWIHGLNGVPIDSFTTNGPIHTSPSVADIDGDASLEILFYDWGDEELTSIPDATDTFWCLNYSSYREANYVYVDTEPPILEKEVGEPKEIDGSNYYITPSTPITIDGYDVGCNGGVGLESIEYRVWWNGAWSSWTQITPGESIYLTNSCTHYLEIRLKDKVGNTIVDNETFYVDDTPPTSSKEIGEPSEGDYVTTSTPITLTAEDTGDCAVGSWRIHYRIWYNGVWGSWNVGDWNTAVVIYFTESCQHKLEWYAEDSLGNEESHHQQTHYVDDTPPTTIKEIVHGNYNVTTDTLIWLNATDGGECGAGVAILHYEVWWDSDNDSIVDTLLEDVTVSDNGEGDNNPVEGEISALVTFSHYGIHEIKWWSEDLLGNSEEEKQQEHRVIVKAPILVITKDAPEMIQPGDNFFYIINVTNIGNDYATDVIVIDDYDELLISIQNAGGGNDDGDKITWQKPLLSPGETVEYIVGAKVHYPLENTIIANFVNVTCNEGVKDEALAYTTVFSAPHIEVDKKAVDVNGPPLEPGDKIRYIIFINNTGKMNQGDNYGHEFVDDIPSHTAYVEDSLYFSSGSGVYNAALGRIEWDGEVLANGTVIIAFNVTVSTPLDNGTIICNQGIANWDDNGDGNNNAYEPSNDPTTPIDDDPTCMTVISSPILSIEKEDKQDVVEAGSRITYTIWINNTGNANATDVVVTEFYDANVSFINATPSPSIGDNVWTFPEIGAGDGKVITLNVITHFPLPDGTLIVNKVNVSCAEGESDEDIETTLVASIPLLELDKTATPTEIENAGTILYTILVHNNGTEMATNVTVTETFDPLVVFNFSYPEPDDKTNKTWTFDNLDVCQTKSITIGVDVLPNVEEGTVITNFVHVTCDENVTDNAWANVTVVASPPITVKKFLGEVENVTLFDNGTHYVLHFIPNGTIIDLVSEDMPLNGGSGVNHTYYRIFKWDPISGKWIMFFDWEEYGEWNPFLPFYPIDLWSLGNMYGYGGCGKYEIEFYSIDKMGNKEGVRWNDVFVDCYPPSSSVNSISPYEKYEPFNITANAIDEGVGVERVDLYYRYSEDNVSWSAWTFYGSMTDEYKWNFVPPDGIGYYQFYSVAIDKVGNMENLPDESTIPDAICKVTMPPWDVNEDGDVNILDVVIVAQHWGESGTPGWIRADVNKDGKVDILDLTIIGQHWTG